MPRTIDVDKLLGVTVHFLYQTGTSIHHNQETAQCQGCVVTVGVILWNKQGWKIRIAAIDPSVFSFALNGSD